MSILHHPVRALLLSTLLLPRAMADAAGKPLWITEADRGMRHLDRAPDFDLPWPGERLKAEALIQEYVLSLAAGSAQHFHFVLGHYHEPNGVQFGLLRRDLTPRPAYVALAATGRFLAGARFLGSWHPGDDVQVIAFRAHPNGQERDVILLWAEKPVDWEARGQHAAVNPLPANLQLESVYDYLGRPRPMPHRLRSAPWFVVLPAGEARSLPLSSPHPASVPESLPPQAPSPIVLQILWPSDRRIQVTDLPWSEAHAYAYNPGEAVPLQIGLYNFGSAVTEGTLAVDALPTGWSLAIEASTIQLEPGDRKLSNALFLAREPAPELPSGHWIRVRGDFSFEQQPVVAFRCRQLMDEVRP